MERYKVIVYKKGANIDSLDLINDIIFVKKELTRQQAENIFNNFMQNGIYQMAEIKIIKQI